MNKTLNRLRKLIKDIIILFTIYSPTYTLQIREEANIVSDNKWKRFQKGIQEETIIKILLYL